MTQLFQILMLIAFSYVSGLILQHYFFNYEKVLILDVSKWKCGQSSENSLGEGPTKLMNSLGYMCCLGQFSLQIDKNINKEDLRLKNFPQYIGFKNKNILIDENGYDSNLTSSAISINDNTETTPKEKIVSLKKLFKKFGYKIEVINADKISEDGGTTW
jgi:hypothetical protein